jgi:type VI secretion system protein ImpK
VAVASPLLPKTYAFAALVDETVLTSPSSLRQAWERRPLQLELFGDQLAGEHFFDRLDELRGQGAPKVQVLEVFHMALLMGFQGKYRIEGPEKLGFLTARLGDEVAQLRGTRPGFAPHSLASDSVQHKLRHEVPLWVMASAFALAGLLAFIGLRWWLDRQTGAELAGYQGIVKMPEQPAYVTITLP